MNPKYAEEGTIEIRLIEELSELIRELCKADRFGWYNWHPDDPNKIPNKQRVIEEIDDVMRLCIKLKDAL